MKNCVRILIVAFAIAVPQGAHAERRDRTVPRAIQVPPGYTPYLAAHAIGTQGYVCVAVGSAYGWTAFGPQATLFNGESEQILAHFLSPTPYSLLPGPAWQHRDSAPSGAGRSDLRPIRTSAPGGRGCCSKPLSSGTAHLGRQADGRRPIQRLNMDGMAPSTGCSRPEDIKKGHSCPISRLLLLQGEDAQRPRED
jgi:hypothetical protein